MRTPKRQASETHLRPVRAQQDLAFERSHSKETYQSRFYVLQEKLTNSKPLQQNRKTLN